MQQNPGFAGFLTDDDFRVRFAMNFTPTGGQVLQVPEEEKMATQSGKTSSNSVRDAMTSGPAGFDKTGDNALPARQPRPQHGRPVRDGPQDRRREADRRRPAADVGGVLVHPTEKNDPSGLASPTRRTEWKILDQAIAADFDYLKKLHDGEFHVTSRTLDDKHWTVAYMHGQRPGEVLSSTIRRAGTEDGLPVHSNRDDLENYPLVKMHDRVIKSRDGLNLVSYLSLPPGSDPDGDGMPERAAAAGARMCTADLGRATTGARSGSTNGSPTAAMRC